jgi:hypothetical protein
MIFDPTGKDDCLMLDSRVINRYIHAGNGEVTLVSPQSNKAHSYAFSKPSDERQFPENTIFVYALHEGHKLYLGMLDGNGFRLTARSRFDEDTEIVKGARYIVAMSIRQDLVDKKKMHLYHSGRCCLCGRKLNGLTGLHKGMGKMFLKKYNNKLNKVPWNGN